jgi:hypothetical protein
MNNVRPVLIGIAVSAASAGAAGVLATTGSAAAGPAPADRSAARSFVLTVHHGSDSTIDLGKSGFSAGDQDLFTGRLTRGSAQAGHLTGSCTTARVGRTSADQLCEFVLRLTHGQITAAGTVRSGQQGPGTFKLPILGGSGAYRTAAGQIAVSATNGRTFPITVSLR